MPSPLWFEFTIHHMNTCPFFSFSLFCVYIIYEVKKRWKFSSLLLNNCFNLNLDNETKMMTQWISFSFFPLLNICVCVHGDVRVHFIIFLAYTCTRFRVNISACIHTDTHTWHTIIIIIMLRKRAKKVRRCRI